jgi:hypothetical protein
MQLRSGKIINAPTKKEEIVQVLGKKFAALIEVPLEDVPSNIAAISDYYSTALENIDRITDTRFKAGKGLVQEIYYNTFEVRSVLVDMVRQYISDNNIRDPSEIYHQAGSLLELIGNLHMAINDRCPKIKAPMYCGDPECPCDGYL